MPFHVTSNMLSQRAADAAKLENPNTSGLLTAHEFFQSNAYQFTNPTGNLVFRDYSGNNYGILNYNEYRLTQPTTTLTANGIRVRQFNWLKQQAENASVFSDGTNFLDRTYVIFFKIPNNDKVFPLMTVSDSTWTGSTSVIPGMRMWLATGGAASFGWHDESGNGLFFGYTPGVYSVDTWHMLTVTFDSSQNVKLIKDNNTSSPVRSYNLTAGYTLDPTAYTRSNYRFTFGDNANKDEGDGQGELGEEVYIAASYVYNRVLSNTEISDLYTFIGNQLV